MKAITDASGEAVFSFDASVIDKALENPNPGPAAPVTKVWVRVRAACENVDYTFTDRAEITNGGQPVDISLAFDFAIVCVGHVTEATARIWFGLTHPPLAAANYSIRVFPSVLNPPARVRSPVADVTSALAGQTGVVEVAGLASGTSYQFHLVRHATPTLAERRLAMGSFTTRPAVQGPQLRLAFGSCVGLRHVDASNRAILPALAAQSRDALLLLGDQLYAGHVSGSSQTAASVSRQFDRMYARQWAQRDFRECLRRGATYMVLEDHDVADDWGTAFTSSTRPALVAGGLDAFERWQHSHNPPTPTGVYHYTLRFGPVALFVMDQRSMRGVGSDRAHFVLGAAQAADLVAWLTNDAASADIAVIVSPVPMAFFPARTVTQLVNAAVDFMRLHVQAAGASLGGVLGGAGGAVAGWYLGGELFDLGLDALAGERFVGDRIVEPDVADQWVAEDNRAELRFILQHLFDYANDVAGGGQRYREVVILSGDSHVGMMHEIRSTDSAHAARPLIKQFTSSPLNRAIDTYWDEPLVQAIVADVVDGLDFPPPFTARFLTEPPLLAERNHGMLTVTRIDQRHRTYRLQAQIRGTGRNMSADWVAMLDSNFPIPTPTTPSPPAPTPPPPTPSPGFPPRHIP